jgi:hypothetical protein
MANAPVSVKISIAWWLKPYVFALTFFAALMGATPDAEKLKRTIRRALTITFKFD